MSMVSIVFGGFIVAYSPKIEALYTPKATRQIEQSAPVSPPADSILIQDQILMK
jgi:hypothetical protein